MSALPPIADVCRRIEHVCFVPTADISPLAWIYLSTSDQWPANPKKVCSNCLFKTTITVAQNKDADITPSKNQANFPFMLDDRLRTESRCASF